MTTADIAAAGGDITARRMATSFAAQVGEFDLNAQDYLSAAKPLIKLVPPNLRAQLLAGENGPNAPDFAPYIQKGLELYRVIDLQGMQVNCKTPIQLSGFEALLMGGGRLWANMTNPADAVFALKPVPAGTPQIVSFYLEGFGSVTGPASVFRLLPAEYLAGMGITLKVRNMTFNGLAKVAGMRFLDAQLVDFVDLRGLTILNYDKAFNVDVPAAVAGNRGNTQIIFDLIGIQNTNTVGYIANTGLARLNFDAMYTGAGLKLGENNDRVILDRCHVEYVGYKADWTNSVDAAAGTSTFGWAIDIKDNVNFGSVVLNNCTLYGKNTTETVSNPGIPLGGLRLGKHENGTQGAVVVRDSYIAPTSTNAPSWIPLEAHYNLRWEGKWISSQQSNVKLADALSVSDAYTDIVIDEGQLARHGDRNLLPGNKLINLRNTTGSGTVAIAEYSDTPFEGGQTITFAATSSTERTEDVPLSIGWYTMLVSGSQVSGTVFASVRSDANYVLRRQFLTLSTLAPTTFHMPFYVATAATYRVGFQAVAAASAIVDEYSLVRGLYPGNLLPGAWTYPPVIALPAPSARWEGKGVTYNGHIYVCINATGGYVWSQIA